jgi:7-cyano-7-deazaguanine reductase
MTQDDMPLGRTTTYPETYDPGLLFPVRRAGNRRELGLGQGDWPWYGEDRWQAWEISWLRPDGVPRVAVGEFRVPADSPCLIESKSFKLYLNSLNNRVFPTQVELIRTLETDLSETAGALVSARLFPVEETRQAQARPGEAALIDDAGGVVLPADEPLSHLVEGGGERVQERLCSHLLRSLCPVTGQPDWGTLLIEYEGPRMNRGALLGYIIGFREQRDFHEHCVERIFTDLQHHLGPGRLSVGAWYTRRGGLDINPWRSTDKGSAPAIRLCRQ